MPGAQLLGLQHPVNPAVREGLAHALAAMAVNHMDRRGIERARRVDDMGQQRPAGQRLQHLRQVARHALALACGQDDDG